MRTTKFITLTALFTALLLAVQLALSGIAGVELVTVTFLSFCFCAGIFAGITVAVSFSLIRCFLFGFYPTVIILYLTYYVLFALFFGFVGVRCKHELTVKSYITAIIFVVVFTAVFTLLDDVITPIFYGFNERSTVAYFYASLPFMLTQCICALVSSVVLFAPIVRALNQTALKR